MLLGREWSVSLKLTKLKSANVFHWMWRYFSDSTTCTCVIEKLKGNTRKRNTTLDCCLILETIEIYIELNGTCFLSDDNVVYARLISIKISVYFEGFTDLNLVYTNQPQEIFTRSLFANLFTNRANSWNCTSPLYFFPALWYEYSLQGTIKGLGWCLGQMKASQLIQQAQLTCNN